MPKGLPHVRFRCLAVGPRNRHANGSPLTQGVVLTLGTDKIFPATWEGGRWPLTGTLVRSIGGYLRIEGDSASPLLVHTVIDCDAKDGVVARLRITPQLLSAKRYHARFGLGGLFAYCQKALQLPPGSKFLAFTSTSPTVERARFDHDIRCSLACLLLLIALHVQYGVDLQEALFGEVEASSDGDGGDGGGGKGGTRSSQLLCVIVDRAKGIASKSAKGGDFREVADEIKAAVAEASALAQHRRKDGAESVCRFLSCYWSGGAWEMSGSRGDKAKD